MRMMWQLPVIAVLGVVSCKARPPESGRGALKGVSYIYRIDGSAVKAEIDASGVVKFYMDTKGQREEIISVDEAYSAGAIRAIQDGAQNWKIQWQGVTIGAKKGNDSEICGPRFGFAEICDATFIQRDPKDPKGKNLLILGLLDKGLEQLSPEQVVGGDEPGNMNLSDSTRQALSGFADISNYATTEINQNGTGTCLFNSTTGLLEWYRNRETGKVERLSAPYVLARLFEKDDFSGELGALNQTQKLKKALPDSVFPTQETYNQFTTFQGVYSYAKQRASGLSSGQVTFPAVKGTKLFMLSEPALGEFGTQGASAEQMKMVRDWIINKKRPVHFFHYYYNTGIWHAVMAIGWDDSRQMIKIKDSLSQSGQRGQWKSISSYRAMAYGALGTEEVGGPTQDRPDASRPNQSDKENETSPTTPSTNNPTINSPTTPSTPTTPVDNSLLAELRWMAIIQGSTMYLYISEDVSDVSIRGYGNAWLPTTDSYVPQTGAKTIRGIYVNRASWLSHSTVDVRVLYKGKYVAASVPLEIR